MRRFTTEVLCNKLSPVFTRAGKEDSVIRINTNHKQLEVLRDYDKKEALNPNYYRISGEFRYLCAFSDSQGGKYDSLIEGTAKKLAAGIAENHCTTKTA
jgi:hypothetical protein